MRYQLAYKASTKDLVVQAYGAALPGGYSNIGDFYHDGGGTDVQSSYPGSHVLYHEIQDALYKIGEQNMQAVRINITYVTGISVSPTSTTKAPGATQQLTTTFTPAAPSNTDLVYTSSDPTKATVNASGLITAVATGAAKITVTSKDGGFKGTCDVTVS